MNPAEEIVKYWLQRQGYFLESSISVGYRNREIDILAWHPLHPEKKRHIEVSVGIRMMDPKNTVESKAREYLDKKFDDKEGKIRQKIREKFGGDVPYTRELVVGDVQLKQQGFDEFANACKALGIEVIHFSTPLREVMRDLTSATELNPIIKTVQLCKKFIPCVETDV